MADASAVALLAGFALAALAGTAAAQDATWLLNPATGDFNTGGNWTPATVPTGTASFGVSNTINLTFSAPTTTIGRWTFDAGASNYTFTNNAQTLDFVGAGIVVNGGGLSITNNGPLQFLNSSSAGGAGITNNNLIEFFNNSSAGSAAITNGNTIRFRDSSSAGGATITNNSTLEFRNTSSAGGAGITNSSNLQFFNTASAGNATIVNNDFVGFNDASSAGSAAITNNSGLWFRDTSSAGSAAITNVASVEFFANSTAGSATIVNNNGVGFNDTSSAGSAAITNFASLLFRDTSSAGSAAITNNGFAQFVGGSTALTATIANFNTVLFLDNASAGSATITNTGAGSLEFYTTSSAGSANIANSGFLRFSGASSAGTATIVNNSVLRFENGSTAGSATITTNANGSTAFLDATTGGTARFILEGNGELDISGRAGGVSIGSLEGTGGLVRVGGETLTVGTRNTNGSFGGVIRDDGLAGGLTKVGTGTLTLTGTSTYTGPTQVDGGRLIVDGSLASPVTIGANGTFGGSGTIPQLTINGTVSPGNSPGTLTVNGNVVFGPGGVYVAEIEGAQADRINATGTAQLAGTLRLVPLGGTYLFNTPYTLLRAQGGRTGTFGIVQTQGSFGAGITSQVAYTGADVNLTLAPAPLAPIVALGPLGIGSPRNPAAVAAGFDAALAAGANLDAFFPLYNQSAANLPGALNTFSGEVHTSAAAMGFDVSGRFLSTMLDPFALGRRGQAGSSMGASSFYAAEQYAKAPGPLDRIGRTSLDVAAPDPRNSVWGSVFGATGHVDGSAGAGSARRDSDHAGVAVGADWRFDPNAAIGFAVSGAKANASLAGGRGSAEADAFQAGLYGMARAGAFSFGASAAYSWLDVEARRTVPVLGFQPLSAKYGAHGFGVRAEAAWEALRFGGMTLSPTAAIQAQSIRTDAFRETAAPGAAAGVAALAVNGRTSNALRTELGLRLNADFRAGATYLTAFGSVAWAHYLERDMTMSASIAALPAASFVVEGARRDRDAALVGLGLDIRLTPAVSITARADGAFSANSGEIGGSAALRVRF
ncbi:autotransporter domain-containing protein [Bosea sp. 685]|uniref:autotransporter outer membrane beta-barrel domain-containing protein n=1 Tax=Bosea sp. 685 TaxID=3080057 RepID=UPI0028935143|nr:autotransporter domain-containing protein [Bosea sp. 685]WNJ88103.1 autotransporter domain-containing protein [Bosea sp. 685]